MFWQIPSSGNVIPAVSDHAEKKEIIEILYKYGDEKHAKVIAEAICEMQKIKPILTTIQLASLIKNVYPEKKVKINPLVNGHFFSTFFSLILAALTPTTFLR